MDQILDDWQKQDWSKLQNKDKEKLSTTLAKTKIALGGMTSLVTDLERLDDNIGDENPMEARQESMNTIQKAFQKNEDFRTQNRIGRIEEQQMRQKASQFYSNVHLHNQACERSLKQVERRIHASGVVLEQLEKVSQLLPNNIIDFRVAKETHTQAAQTTMAGIAANGDFDPGRFPSLAAHAAAMDSGHIEKHDSLEDVMVTISDIFWEMLAYVLSRDCEEFGDTGDTRPVPSEHDFLVRLRARTSTVAPKTPAAISPRRTTRRTVVGADQRKILRIVRTHVQIDFEFKFQIYCNVCPGSRTNYFVFCKTKHNRRA